LFTGEYTVLDRKKYDKIYRDKNRERRKEYGEKWRTENRVYMKEYQTQNKESGRKRQKEWRSKNKEHATNTYLIKSYGITLDDYNRLFIEQEGCCAICGKHQSELNRPLFVDHNHETNQIRGLLCPSCNTGIGNFNDDIPTITKAIQYLTAIRHESGFLLKE